MKTPYQTGQRTDIEPTVKEPFVLAVGDSVIGRALLDVGEK
jgi:hypothetical protein